MQEQSCDLQDYTRRLREEQDAEFQQSLEADRQREAAAAAEAERQAAAAQEAAHAEAQARCEALHHPLGALPGGPCSVGTLFGSTGNETRLYDADCSAPFLCLGDFSCMWLPLEITQNFLWPWSGLWPLRAEPSGRQLQQRLPMRRPAGSGDSRKQLHAWQRCQSRLPARLTPRSCACDCPAAPTSSDGTSSRALLCCFPSCSGSMSICACILAVMQ
jgi:hypothetical protein